MPGGYGLPYVEYFYCENPKCSFMSKHWPKRGKCPWCGWGVS